MAAYDGYLKGKRVSIPREYIYVGPDFVESNDKKYSDFPQIKEWVGYLQLPDFLPMTKDNKISFSEYSNTPDSGTWLYYNVMGADLYEVSMRSKFGKSDVIEFYKDSWSIHEFSRKADVFSLEVYTPIWLSPKNKKNNDGYVLYIGNGGESYIICASENIVNLCKHYFFLDKDKDIFINMRYSSRQLVYWQSYENKMRKTVESFFRNK